MLRPYLFYTHKKGVTMKLRKQIKNRIVAVAMLAVVLFGSLSFAKPETAYAATYSYTQIESWRGAKGDVFTTTLNPVGAKDSKMFVTMNNSHTATDFFIIGGSEPFSISWSKVKKGSTDVSNGKANCTGNVVIDGHTYHYYHYGYTYPAPSNGVNWYDFTWSGASGVYSYSEKKYSVDELVTFFISGKLPVDLVDVTTTCNSSTDQSAWQGSQDNPIPDENIGTLVLKKSKCYWVKDGSMDVSQRVQWANKTDTNFSLTNNKYAITRIEVKIGNRVTYFGDVEHHGTGKKVDNFGKVYPFKYVIATDNPHDFSFKDMLSASKTDLTKYNAAMLEHEYDLYFRVVCGTAYGTSAEWHCGNWTRYRVTDDPKQDGKNESDNGHFNDKGEWEKDKDTDVDSGGIGNVDDKDDLEDDFNHFKDSENWKDWLNKEGLDLDSAKTFIDQVADVPKMIGDLFSFFPDWVKYSFALGFGLIPVIIVIKFLRG